jgi:hypothetical protein
MSVKDPYADIIDKYFKCKKLLTTAEQELFQIEIPMEDLTEHESNFNRFKKDMKQLNFAKIYSKDNTDFKMKVNEIYEYLEEFFLNNFKKGKQILNEAGGSDDEPMVTSQKGLKDILTNIKNLEKKIGKDDKRKKDSKIRPN